MVWVCSQTSSFFYPERGFFVGVEWAVFILFRSSYQGLSHLLGGRSSNQGLSRLLRGWLWLGWWVFVFLFSSFTCLLTLSVYFVCTLLLLLISAFNISCISTDKKYIFSSQQPLLLLICLYLIVHYVENLRKLDLKHCIPQPTTYK